MNVWTWIPLPAMLSLLLTAGVAAGRKGPPAGRTLLVILCLGCVVCLGGLAMVQAEPMPAWAGVLDPLTGLIVPMLAALWIAFAYRFGQGTEPRVPRLALVAVGALLVALGLVGWRWTEGNLTWSDQIGPGYLVDVDSVTDRALTFFVILSAALGILRFQTLSALARREGRARLRRATLGPLLGSLVLFLLASQAILYGRTSIRIVSLASLFLVPSSLLLLSCFRSTKPEETSIPSWVRGSISSLVLIGLGSFLIAMAVMGEVIHRYLPGPELIWFQSGGAILLLFFASLWLIPGLRETLRRWFGTSQSSSGNPRWEWARVNQALIPVESPAQLSAKLTSLIQDLLGRTAVALWLVSPSGDRMAPVGEVERGIPPLLRENPLLAALQEGNGVLDLSRPPQRLFELPPYVENQDLIDRLGFRIFVTLRVGDEILGVLGLAPKPKHIGPETLGLLENVGAQLSNVVWGMTLAERLARTREGESLHRLGSFVLHDLKNALSVLGGAVANARAHMEDPRFRTDLVTTLESTVSRMEGTLSRLRAGVVGEPAWTAVSLPCAFERLEHQFRPLAEQAGVQLELEAGVSPLRTDADRLETILHNLLRNAIEASPQGGVVKVTANTTNGAPEDFGTEKGKSLCISVSDQGKKPDIERIRLAFRRPIPSNKPEGWGIGLFQSHLLAESLGGDLRAEALPEVGLRVILTLPPGRSPADPPAA